jgi:hypothetical protein
MWIEMRLAVNVPGDDMPVSSEPSDSPIRPAMLTAVWFVLAEDTTPGFAMMR